MKKLIAVIGVLAFTAGIAVAEDPKNKSDIQQTGKHHYAEVNQTDGKIESYVIQSNKHNSAIVNQTMESGDDVDKILSNINQSGKYNEAIVEQIHDRDWEWQYAGPGGLIETYINQSGNHNMAKQIQGDHRQLGNLYAEIDQSGNHNWAEQNQQARGNSAYINQGGNNNEAYQAQDTELPPEALGSMNYALIDQAGNHNHAAQQQNGWSMDAEIYQGGNSNEALQMQDGWVNDAYISQDGNNNWAVQDQYGDLNYGSIVQSSNNNIAEQHQISTGKGSNPYVPINYGEIEQKGGNHNKAYQTQTSGYPGGKTEDGILNEAIIWQDGGNNWAEQVQNYKNNYSKIDQLGDHNSADVYQNGSNPNWSEIMQHGNHNTAIVNQLNP